MSWLALAMALLFWPPPMVAGGRLAVLGGAGRMRALPSWPGWRIAVPALPVGALVALAAIGTTVTLGPALGLAAGVTAATTAALAGAAVRGRREREQRREALAAVRAMTAEAHAGGHAAALFGAGAGVAPLLADQLEAAAARAALGECAPEVLHAPPLVGMAHAWRVSHHTGIALADVFTRVSADLSAVQRRHAEVSAALAGPRASALLLAGLPVVGLAMGEGMGAHPVHVLLATTAGRVVCAVGVLLEAAGVAWTAAITRRAQR